MSNTDTLIQREIDREAEAIQRALASGGLPTEAEVAEFYRALGDAAEQLESLTWRIEGIAASDMGDGLPFDVSLEQIGIVATLVSDAEGEIRTLTSMTERARSRISQLSAIRAEQQFKRGSDA
jgi:hypothetical protein